MILDQLVNAETYRSLHPLFPAAFNYLRSFDLNTPDGKYELSGNNLVAMVERYVTKAISDKEWEAHNVYGDIQVLMQGREQCGHAERASLEISKPYQTEKDVEKYMPPNFSASVLVLKPGMFAIFYPQDAHQPSIRLQEPEPVLKVVLKFRLELDQTH